MSAPALAHDSNCDNSATDGSSIHCEQDSTSTDGITIDVDGVSISTSGNQEAGIKAEHEGGTTATPANITIDVTGTSTKNTISTSNASSDGIRGQHSGTGNVDIDAEDITITTTGTAGSTGIRGQHSGTGNVDIDVEDVTVTTTSIGSDAGGIHAQHSGTGNIDIDATAVSISTAGTDASGTDVSAEGVEAIHTGTGNITINVQGKTTGATTTPSTITTTTTRSRGIFAEQNPATGKTGGDIDITLRDTQINTGGDQATGLDIVQRTAQSSGAITATLNSGVTITTGGEDSYGVLLDHKGNVDNTSRDVTLTAGEIAVRTTGENAFGFWVRRQDGDGDVTINADGSEITTENNHAIGIHAYHLGDDNDGDIAIDVRNGSITTGSVVEEGGTSTPKGYGAHGIYARHQNKAPANTVGTGNIRIETRNFDITTTGTAADPRFGALGATVSFGIAAVQEKTGNIEIVADGGSVSTAGAYSYGLQGDHKGDGDVDIETRNGHSITTTGRNGNGIVAFHFGTASTRSMEVTVGGPITVSGAGARGVLVGTVSSVGVPSRMAALDDEGFRLQTVTVNGPITSAAEGVYLANGGRVTIGPRGSISSTKGIAILATGTVPDPDSTDPNTAAIPPKLYVDLDLDGRMVSQVIGDDWIINDGGETTIEINDVVLHRGDTGVALDENGAPRFVANGAWDIYMLADGVKVTDRSNADPAMWTVSTRAAGVIADRDFSASDFTEARVRCPVGQSGFPNCRGPSPPPEPEPEAMQVNEEIMADEDEMAAVHIEGDGAVHIGPQGSLRAASGIAILASGDAPELTVDLDLDGRTVMQVIGDDWIINDGGGTTIIVNGVTLHDAITGVVPDAVAPNGAYNLRTEAPGMRIRAEGVRVLDRSDPDPANWTISAPAEGVIADRDFSAADFITTQTGTGPEPQPPMFVEEYAPRAAVYEALPSVLLGLQERSPAVQRPRQPTWITVTGHTGSQDFARSTVGSEYDIDAVQVEAGKHFTLKGGTEAWATLQYLDGTAEVDSPYQGGDIDVQGLRLSLELCRGCKDGEKYVSGEV
ncbi:MAG: hypothetical protein OXG06_01085, partial [Gammaproteobacteria bacterium]|nr:hypothetical protein [Gammaproteobacteria bacterium]